MSLCSWRRHCTNQNHLERRINGKAVCLLTTTMNNTSKGKHMNKTICKSLLIFSTLFISQSAMAQSKAPALSTKSSASLEQKISFGPTLGVSLTPEQLVLGGTVVVSNVASQPFGISAGGLLGLGDNLTTIRGFGHAFYEFPLTGQDFSLHALGGLSVIRYDFNCGELFGADFDCDSTNLGIDLGGGATHGNFRGEVWLGIGDVPDATLSLSYIF